MPSNAKIRSILVPTDFSNEAQVAFYHALRLAIALRAQLEVLHVEPENDQSDWRWGPHLVETLIRWGYLKTGATVADLAVLGIHVRKQLIVGTDVVTATLLEVARTHCDLVVIATHGRTGLSAWLQPSVAMPLALRGTVPVLVVPAGDHGFVDSDTGGIQLSRVFVPIDHRPHPAPAFDATKILLSALPEEPHIVATMHVGHKAPDSASFAADARWTVLNWTADGPVLDTLLEAAQTWDADLVVCVTEGKQTVGDMFRGSTVERLIHSLHAPILVVPDQWGTDQLGVTSGVSAA